MGKIAINKLVGKCAIPAMITGALMSVSIANAADKVKEPTVEVKSIERIAPDYRAAAPDFMATYTSLDQVKAITDLLPHEYGELKPAQLIGVESMNDGHKIEVAIYKPKFCEENTPSCPVFKDAAVRQDRRLDRPLIIFSHPGGYLFRVAYYQADLYQMIANTTQSIVAVPKYRMSFEKPFPAPIEDVYSVLDYLYNNAAEYKINTDSILLMGSSAGGGLTASLSLYNRDHYDFPIAGQVLIYPMLDYRTGTDKSPYKIEVGGEVCWNAESNVFAWNQFGNAEAAAKMTDNPRTKNISKTDYLGYFSPAMAKDLSKQPDTFIYVGSLDLFANESLNYASKLIEANNAVTIHMENGLFHLFDVANPQAKQTQEFFKDMFTFINERLYK